MAEAGRKLQSYWAYSRVRIAGNTSLLVKADVNDVRPTFWNEFLFPAASGTTTVTITAAGISIAGSLAVVNKRDNRVITPASLAYTGRAVNTNASLKVAVTAATIDYAEQNVFVFLTVRKSVTAATTTYLGQAQTVNAKRLVVVTTATVTNTPGVLTANSQTAFVVLADNINYSPVYIDIPDNSGGGQDVYQKLHIGVKISTA
jgi:phage antirepressor YoqD-like protein